MPSAATPVGRVEGVLAGGGLVVRVDLDQLGDFLPGDELLLVRRVRVPAEDWTRAEQELDEGRWPVKGAGRRGDTHA